MIVVNHPDETTNDHCIQCTFKMTSQIKQSSVRVYGEKNGIPNN